MPDPEDPITQLAAGAAAAHEMYTAYTDAGFNEHQALYLVGQILAASVRGPAS